MTIISLLPRILHHSSNSNNGVIGGARNSNSGSDQHYGDPATARLLTSHGFGVLERVGHQMWTFPLTQWHHSRRPSDVGNTHSGTKVNDEQESSCEPESVKKFQIPSLKDFRKIKTLGTGTFARVWLVKLRHPHHKEKTRLFALKVLRKEGIVRLKQVEHVQEERRILASVDDHPFITNLVASFQDQDCIYLLLDYCPGGELFSYLRRARQFSESTARFYAAEIVLVLQFLHESKGVAYRDLKPENILVDAQGHLKLADFGFAKRLGNTETYTLCGTPEYIAPEVIRNTGHGCAVDWWALGILIYEFLVGQPPFWDKNPLKIYEQIVEGNIQYPSTISSDARSLIGGLCMVDTSKRLGNIKGGASTVMSHPWFRSVDWDALSHLSTKVPMTPVLRYPTDTRNFEEYDLEPFLVEPPYTDDMREQYDDSFKDF